MNDLITKRPSQNQYRKPLDLLIPKSNQISFGYKSFRILALTIWNTLLAEIQALTKLNESKTKIGKINCVPAKNIVIDKSKPNITHHKVSKLFIHSSMERRGIF